MSIRAEQQALRDALGTKTWRTAAPTRCPDCKRWTYAGLDADDCAWRATVDPTPLSPVGEAIARLLGMRTYRLTRAGEGTAIVRRTRWDIAAHPAGGRLMGQPYDVVTDHQCTQPQLDRLPSVIDRRTITFDDQEPPCPY